MKYKKVNSVISGKIVLFGCGGNGKKCYQYLMKHSCEIFAVCDNSLDKIDTKFFEHTIRSIDDVIKKSSQDFTVIIAIKAYESVYKQLRELNVSNIILYTERGMFSLEDLNQDVETLTKTIADKTIYITGDDKYVEDFMYIFSDIKAERTKIIPELKTGTFVIVCKLYDEDVIIGELEKSGYRKGIDYVEGAAFMQLLDGNKAKSADSPSLLMMQTEFPMRGDLGKKEPEIQKHWDELNIYEKRLALNEKNDTFFLHDGPPYANGKIHVGHALNKTLKDFIIRYMSMCGYYSPFQPGWDTHGLPIENALSKDKKVNRKAMSLSEFRTLCEQYAKEQVEMGGMT